MTKFIDILKFLGSGALVIIIILVFAFLIFSIIGGSIGMLKFGLDYLFS